MKPEDVKFFDSCLDRAETKPGFDKWICGHLFHVDRDIHELFEECPQCKEPLHPKIWYRPKPKALLKYNLTKETKK